MLTAGVTFVGTVVAKPASFDSDPAATERVRGLPAPFGARDHVVNAC